MFGRQTGLQDEVAQKASIVTQRPTARLTAKGMLSILAVEPVRPSRCAVKAVVARPSPMLNKHCFIESVVCAAALSAEKRFVMSG